MNNLICALVCGAESHEIYYHLPLWTRVTLQLPSP